MGGYPTASDFALVVSLLLVQVELLHDAHYFSVLLSCLFFGLCMFPTMNTVWLARNAGNANFLYNMILVINVFGCLLISDWVRSGMRAQRRARLHGYCQQVISGLVDKV